MVDSPTYAPIFRDKPSYRSVFGFNISRESLLCTLHCSMVLAISKTSFCLHWTYILLRQRQSQTDKDHEYNTKGLHDEEWWWTFAGLQTSRAPPVTHFSFTFCYHCDVLFSFTFDDQQSLPCFAYFHSCLLLYYVIPMCRTQPFSESLILRKHFISSNSN